MSNSLHLTKTFDFNLTTWEVFSMLNANKCGIVHLVTPSWLPRHPPLQRSPLRAEGIRNAHRWQAESSAAPNGPSAWTLVLCFSRHYLVHQHSLCFLWEKMKMRATNDSKLCYLCSPEGWDSQKSLSWESEKISGKDISCLILDRNIIF